MGHAAFVDHVAGQRGEAHVTPGDDPALAVADRVAGEQVEALAGLDQAAVVEVVGRRREVVPRAQGADVMQVAAAHQLHVAALDQRTVGCQPTLRLGQVDHRREDLLAVHLDLFQPHDVVGQRRHLLRAQAHTQLQVQLVLVGRVGNRQRMRCPGERPARDNGAGGSGLCGCGDSEVLHGALLLNRKCKLLKSKELLNGENLPAF